MCFHGRSNSLVAGDSVTGTGAVSAADEIEPDVMGGLQNRSRKCPLSAVLKGLFRWKRMLPNGIPFGGLALCKTKCFTRTRVPEYYA
jgi:hypothetical protein